MSERTAELVVLGVRETLFGEAEVEMEALPPTFRPHGSTHETTVPLARYNDRRPMPPAQRFQFKTDPTRDLFRTQD